MPPYDLEEDGQWERGGNALGMILILSGVMLVIWGIVFWVAGWLW